MIVAARDTRRGEIARREQEDHKSRIGPSIRSACGQLRRLSVSTLLASPTCLYMYDFEHHDDALAALRYAPASPVAGVLGPGTTAQRRRAAPGSRQHLQLVPAFMYTCAGGRVAAAG